MGEFSPDELGKEIDQLWSRVSAPTPIGPSEMPSITPALVDAPSASQEAAWEAMSLLKRQHRHQTSYWGEVLEAKERALTASRERQARLELEVNALRERLRGQEQVLYKEGVELQARLQAAVAALQQERERAAEEQAGLRMILEQTRERMAAEAARARQERSGWEKKEQQYLLDLRELQAMAARLRDEGSQAVTERGRLSESLKEAKNALEKTLAELLRERQLRDETEKERSQALKKVDELQRHFEELSKIWEEERAQWRELWDRERSTWETQRAEFSTWEENLRKERQAWHAQLESKEQDQLRFTEQLTRTLRESSEATTKMSAMMRSAADAPKAAGVRVGGRAAKAAALAAVLAAGAAFAWRWASTYHFKQGLARPLAAATPTSLAYDGTLLWSAEWDGRLVAVDPKEPRTAVRTTAPQPGGPFRPVALAAGGDALWSLDAAQARVVRHKAGDPSQLLAVRPSPGPAPTALAFDGEALWSYDAANRLLYRHGADEAAFRSFALDADVVATALAWVGRELWVYDAKTRGLHVFAFEDETFKPRGRYDLGLPVVGLAAGPRGKLWVVAAPGGDRSSTTLVEFSY